MDFAVTDLADWFCAGPISATMCVPSPWQPSRPLLTAGSFSVLGDETAGLPPTPLLSPSQRHALSRWWGLGVQNTGAQSRPCPFIQELATAQGREARRDFCWPGSSSTPSNRRDPHVRQRKHFLGPSNAPSGYKAVPKADRVPPALVLQGTQASLGFSGNSAASGRSPSGLEFNITHSPALWPLASLDLQVQAPGEPEQIPSGRSSRGSLSSPHLRLFPGPCG